MAWKGLQLCGFERHDGLALDLGEQNGCTWLEAFLAIHPKLGLGELARLNQALWSTHPDLAREFSERLFSEYGLRWCERLNDTLRALCATPLEFQDWVDEKAPGVRELAPLLAVPDVRDYALFLRALPTM